VVDLLFKTSTRSVINLHHFHLVSETVHVIVILHEEFEAMNPRPSFRMKVEGADIDCWPMYQALALVIC